MSVQHNETEAINKEFMSLSELLNTDIVEKERKSIEAKLNSMRKDLGEKGQMTKLFDRYHKCIEEVSETREMMQESDGDQDLKKMLQEDITRLLGDSEEYGEIESI